MLFTPVTLNAIEKKEASRKKVRVTCGPRDVRKFEEKSSIYKGDIFTRFRQMIRWLAPDENDARTEETGGGGRPPQMWTRSCSTGMFPSPSVERAEHAQTKLAEAEVPVPGHAQQKRIFLYKERDTDEARHRRHAPCESSSPRSRCPVDMVRVPCRHGVRAHAR